MPSCAQSTSRLISLSTSLNRRNPQAARAPRPNSADRLKIIAAGWPSLPLLVVPPTQPAPRDRPPTAVHIKGRPFSTSQRLVGPHVASLSPSQVLGVAPPPSLRRPLTALDRTLQRRLDWDDRRLCDGISDRNVGFEVTALPALVMRLAHSTGERHPNAGIDRTRLRVPELGLPDRNVLERITVPLHPVVVGGAVPLRPGRAVTGRDDAGSYRP